MKRQWIYFALIFIAILPILLLRDFTADNELKYLSIADEAIENSNIFAFYNHGAPYADKPPLYLWFVMLGKIIFGKHVMFYVSLLSVITVYLLLPLRVRSILTIYPFRKGPLRKKASLPDVVLGSIVLRLKGRRKNSTFLNGCRFSFPITR